MWINESDGWQGLAKILKSVCVGYLSNAVLIFYPSAYDVIRLPVHSITQR
jgi:hypothetical protein